MARYDDSDDAQERDAERKREKRAAAKDLKIPACKNPERRRKAEESSRAWLATYKPEFYDRPLTPQLNALIDAYDQAIDFGGDQALAATRGVGKSTVLQWLTVSNVLRGRLDCVLLVGQNGPKADQNMENIKEIFIGSDELQEDYPEVWIPINDVRSAPQKGMSQTYQRKNTDIEWSANQIAMPKIDGFKGSGSVVASMTIESGDLRGFNYKGKRPKIVIIDDPETEESAVSEVQCKTREKIIEATIGGMGTPDRRVSRLLITTIQNRTCLSWKFTDPALKPSWQGKRFKFLNVWPERRDLWDKYVNMRRREQKDGDPFARKANRFYLDNLEEMNAGVECDNEDAFDHRPAPDGTTIESSAVQSLYNVIADRGEDGFRHVLTEYQNDPPEDDDDSDGDLTPDEVAGRLNNLEEFAVPEDYETLVCQIDLHSGWHYWAVMAASRDGEVHDVVAYGIHTVPSGDEVGTDNAMATALDQLADELESRVWVTTEGRIVTLDLAMVDAGYKQDVGLAFITERRGIWRLSKGRENGKSKYLRPKTKSVGVTLGNHWYSSVQPRCEASNKERWLLIFADTDYWMHQVHSRFRALPFSEGGQRQAGSIAIWGSDRDQHLTPIDRDVARSAYAVQICGWLWKASESKTRGLQMGWQPQWKQDHWLDVTYGCLVADQVLRDTGYLDSIPGHQPEEPRDTFVRAASREKWVRK